VSIFFSFSYLCCYVVVFLGVFSVLQSGVKVKTEPVCVSGDYNKSRSSKEGESSKDKHSQDDDGGDDGHEEYLDYSKLPFKVEERGDKVLIDRSSWEGVKKLMKDQKTVIEKIEGQTSLVLPNVGETALLCPTCGSSFKTNATLQKHIKKSHGLHDRLSCKFCNVTFVSKVVLRKHVSNVHNKDPSSTTKQFHCKMCDSSFPTSWQLGQHSRHVHQKERAIECKFGCGKTYSSAGSMSSHLSSCKKNPNWVKKVCLYRGCEKAYTKQCDLNAHMKKVHGWEKKKKDKGGK
jgi:uncharacterized C2H2 Zn-finger protein